MNPCLDDALKLDYLNGMISERERALFEEHLVSCPECRREIAELRKAAVAVAGLTLPAVPAAWTDAAKKRLRARTCALVETVPSSPPSTRRSTDVFQYAAIAAGVIAGTVLLVWLVMGGVVRRWLPGLSADAGPLRLVTWVPSLLSLLFVPSIIDNIYLLVRRGGRRSHPGSSAGFFPR